MGSGLSRPSIVSQDVQKTKVTKTDSKQIQMTAFRGQGTSVTDSENKLEKNESESQVKPVRKPRPLPKPPVDMTTTQKQNEDTANNHLKSIDVLEKENLELRDEVLALRYQNHQLEHIQEKEARSKDNRIKTISHYESHRENLMARISKLQTENDELKTRLSMMASDRLTDNNPNIANLGDKNRPTNLADKFSELYSNEWTNALESLEKDYETESETANIKTLLEIVKSIYKLCREKADRELEEMKEHALRLVGLKNSTQEINSCIKAFKEARKKHYQATLEAIDCSDIADELLDNSRELTQDVKTYVDRTKEICWIMSVQDPPVTMCFKCRQNKKFDKSLFSEYTQTGDVYDFLVWPALLLHEGGPLLRKGIAQPKQKKKSGKGRKKSKIVKQQTSVTNFNTTGTHEGNLSTDFTEDELTGASRNHVVTDRSGWFEKSDHEVPGRVCTQTTQKATSTLT